MVPGSVTAILGHFEVSIVLYGTLYIVFIQVTYGLIYNILFKNRPKILKRKKAVEVAQISVWRRSNMVEEVKKLKMKIVDFNKKQMKERIEKIKVETEKRIAEGNVQNLFCVHEKKSSTVKSP